MIKNIIFVAIGGASGSIFRFLTSLIIAKYWNTTFPLANFIVNSLGCFLVGLLIGILQKNNLLNTSLHFLLITGFCGGLTTFSTFSYESVALFENNNSFMALIYVGLSIILNLFFTWFGLFLTKNYWV